MDANSPTPNNCTPFHSQDSIFNFFGQKVEMDKAKTRRVYYWVGRRLNQTGVLTWCLIGSLSVSVKAGRPIRNKIRDKVWKCKPNISRTKYGSARLVWSGLMLNGFSIFMVEDTKNAFRDVKRNIGESTPTALACNSKKGLRKRFGGLK